MKWLLCLLLTVTILFAGCEDRETKLSATSLKDKVNNNPTTIEITPSTFSFHDVEGAVEANESIEINEPIEVSREPDVVFVPTPQEVVEKMLELAEVKKEDLVYDLGCGDGRIVVTAAKKYGCKAVGFDIDPKRIEESLQNVEKNNVVDLVRIEERDIFTLDLSEASVITLYLLPELNVKLIPQLEKLKPGSRIVSHDFDMKGVKPDKVVKVTSNQGYTQKHSIYLWITPLKKEEVSEEANIKESVHLE